METPTRLTTRLSTQLSMATVIPYMVVACCGLILLSAVSPYGGREPMTKWGQRSRQRMAHRHRQRERPGATCLEEVVMD